MKVFTDINYRNQREIFGDLNYEATETGINFFACEKKKNPVTFQWIILTVIFLWRFQRLDKTEWKKMVIISFTYLFQFLFLIFY